MRSMGSYIEEKAMQPGALVLHRMGEFYEAFFEDADVAARLLGLPVTARGTHEGQPIPVVGVAARNLAAAVAALRAAGQQVVITES